MRVWLTGASSFTGAWFARALVAAGCSVVAPLTQPRSAYQGLRAARLAALPAAVRLVEAAPFGSAAGLAAIAEAGPFDLAGLHGAHLPDHNNPEFDALEALARNTQNLAEVLAALRAVGCQRVVGTGSIGEPHEGVGPERERAFNAYALSKALSWEFMAHHARRAGLLVDKFVIPNPFGPVQGGRLIGHLLAAWRAGRPAELRTPAYWRDNIHVDLLALAYARFAVARPAPGSVGTVRLAPSQYVETMGDFAGRVAREIGQRTGLACTLACAEQTEFPEPRARHNPDRLDTAALGWSEAAAWDALAAEALAGSTKGEDARTGPSATPGMPAHRPAS